MADAKTTALTEMTDPQPTDLIYAVDDPGGTPAERKLTMQNLVEIVNVLTALTVPAAADEILVIDDPAGTPTGKKITLVDALEVVNVLTALTVPAGVDEILIIDDPAGTPTGKKITLADLLLGSVGIIPTARVYNDAAITLGNATEVDLTFNTERWDTDTIHDTGSLTDRLTCKTAGLYEVSFTGRFAAHGTGWRYIAIYHNATSIAFAAGSPGGTYREGWTVTTQYQMAVNDYFKVAAYQNSGGNLDMELSGNISPEFMMTRIGD